MKPITLEARRLTTNIRVAAELIDDRTLGGIPTPEGHTRALERMLLGRRNNKEENTRYRPRRGA